MPRPYSDAAKRAIHGVDTSAEDTPQLLLEIEHPDLAAPIRVVQGNVDFDHQGNTFQALEFEAHLPEDLERGEPRAKLELDNVGRELVQWLEVSRGGAGATARFIQARRADPDTREWKVVMDLENVDMDPLKVRADLQFDTLANQPAIAVRYTPDTAPGIF